MLDLLTATLFMMEEPSLFMKILGAIFTLFVIFPVFYFVFGLAVLCVVLKKHFLPETPESK